MLGLLMVAPVIADCPLPNPADCVYVDDDCVNDPGTGAQADPFCRIQDSYDSVVASTTPANPATILIRAGVYQECVNASSTFDWDVTLNDDRPVHFARVLRPPSTNRLDAPSVVSFVTWMRVSTNRGCSCCPSEACGGMLTFAAQAACTRRLHSTVVPSPRL
jgi:hypothetical protein